jgi:hypothetical protein
MVACASRWSSQNPGSTERASSRSISFSCSAMSKAHQNVIDTVEQRVDLGS